MRTFLLLTLLGLMSISASAEPLGRGDVSKEVEEKLKSLALKQVKAECENCKIAVECKWIAPTLGNRPASDISVLQFDKLGLPAGYVTAKVGLKGQGFTPTASVQFYISIQKKLPVANRVIRRGVSVSTHDVSWQWKDLSRMNRQPIYSADVLKGKKTARIMRNGDLFFATDLVSAASIAPGDRVSMWYNTAGVNVEIDCIARETKGIGEKIRLYSKETGRQYIAKIVSTTEIIWEKTL